MTDEVPPDVLVLGAGPAGLAAAEAAVGCGLRTVLVDDKPFAAGATTAIAAADHLVWSIDSTLRVDAIGPAGARSWRPRALILATGATPRAVPGSDGESVPHGTTPATEATRLLRVRHVFSAACESWIPACDAHGRTSLPHVYAAGAVTGAADDAAIQQGRNAAWAAAGDLGRDAPRSAPVPAPRLPTTTLASLVAVIPSDVLVCPCEKLSRAVLEAAIVEGARDMNQLRAFTRCGMGGCQGRLCGDVAAELLAVHVGGRIAAGMWTGRAPLRPIPLAALTGRFTYDDIPIPASAPL